MTVAPGGMLADDDGPTERMRLPTMTMVWSAAAAAAASRCGWMTVAPTMAVTGASA